MRRRADAEEDRPGSATVSGSVSVMVRLVVAALLLTMAVLVDFTSRLLSVVSDGVLVFSAIVIMMPILAKVITSK
jgi:hypothetical protein